MIVELQGLQVFGYHGAEEDEQRRGQLFLFDVQLDVGERGANDVLAEAVDYTKVAAAIRELSDAKRHDLLEALATEVADELMRRFRPEALTLRVRKPEVKPAGLTVDFSAVTVRRP
jgi:dihydroneopterin aldolase